MFAIRKKRRFFFQLFNNYTLRKVIRNYTSDYTKHFGTLCKIISKKSCIFATQNKINSNLIKAYSYVTEKNTISAENLTSNKPVSVPSHEVIQEKFSNQENL